MIWSWLRWLLPIAAIAALLYWGRRHNVISAFLAWLKSRRADLVNIASGVAFGVNLKPAKTPVKFDGVAVKIRKGILLAKPGDPWTWVEPGERVPPFKMTLGRRIRFCIVFENHDPGFPMPTRFVKFRDELACRLAHEVICASLLVDGQRIRGLSEEEMTQLTSGVLIPLSDFVDEIPAHQAAQIIYDVRVTGERSETPGRGFKTASTEDMPDSPPDDPDSGGSNQEPPDIDLDEAFRAGAST